MRWLSKISVCVTPICYDSCYICSKMSPVSCFDFGPRYQQKMRRESTECRHFACVCGLLVVVAHLVGCYAEVADAVLPPSPALPVGAVLPNAAFDQADLDHNGIVDRQEFQAWTSRIKSVLVPFLDGFPSREEASKANKNVNAGGIFNEGGLTGGKAAVSRGNSVKRFWEGFMSGIVTIWATEIGDKTFFIAAILSMKHDRVVVFAGAIGALAAMTVLSVVMGGLAAYFLPPKVTHYAGAIMFVVFGARMLYDARDMSSTGPSEELHEVEEELEVKKAAEDAEQVEGGHVQTAVHHTEGMIQVLSQSFFLTFLAEWGDRSQIATITLSAAKDAFGVTLGAILGHSMCTGLAVVGGKFLASRISEKTVTVVGGVLFLLFALHSFTTGPAEGA